MLRALTAAALLTFTVAKAAQADDIDTKYSVQVAYGDLNLSDPASSAVLASRLRTAATTVCDRADTTLPHMTKSEMQLCVATAIEGAMSNLETNLNHVIDANLVQVREQVASAD